MRAPVYRSLEARNSVLGLTFPGEFTLVLVVWWATMIAAGAALGCGFALGAYALVRAANYGRAEGFVQHFLQYQTRGAFFAGRLSAAARVGHGRAPGFPHGRRRFEGEDLASELAELLAARGGGGA